MRALGDERPRRSLLEAGAPLDWPARAQGAGGGDGAGPIRPGKSEGSDRKSGPVKRQRLEEAPGARKARDPS